MAAQLAECDGRKEAGARRMENRGQKVVGVKETRERISGGARDLGVWQQESVAVTACW